MEQQCFDDAAEEEAVKCDAQADEVKKDAEPELPKMSSQEFSIYNHMAEHMNYFVIIIRLGNGGSKTLIYS